MDKNLQNIEDLFRDGLEDNEEMPSQQVWKGIDNILDKDNVVSINKKYALLKRVSLLLLFIVFALIIYEFSNRRNSNSLAKQNSKQALNKEVVTTDNSNKSANILNSKKLNDSVSVNNYNKPNTATYNSSVDKSSPYNHLIIEHGNNSVSKKKTNIVSAYKINIKSSTPVKGFEEVVINNNDKKTDNQLPLLQQLNPATKERINNPPGDSIANNLPPPGVKNIIPPADEVNRLASNKNTKAKNPSRFSSTLFFSPEIAFYHLLADKPDNQPDNASKIEKGEHHEFSSTTGLLFDYRLSKRFALQAGF
ncbi:MAG: hypothetical protein ABIQ07_02300, partial [Ginsengibacter sp.]